jgi:1-phosphatidylinositol phosphodiesterase
MNVKNLVFRLALPSLLLGAVACGNDGHDHKKPDAAVSADDDGTDVDADGDLDDAGDADGSDEDADDGDGTDDAGVPDAGSMDAGLDAGEPDAGQPDAGDLDASTRSNANWMGSIDGTKSLAALSIPGTHDTGALYEDEPGTLKTQDLTIDEQLAAGVRYFDIRVKDVEGHFDVYHKTRFQELSFDQVLTSVFAFFEANPGETLILCLKQEQPPENSTNTFEQTFDTYTAQHPEKWYLGATIPTLDEVRGKIVLMRRFPATSTPKGLDATGFADNTTFTLDHGPGTKLRVQDYYEISDNPAKWTAITNLFDEATAGDFDVLFLNNTSAYLPLEGGVEDILTVSNAINPQLADYFTTNTSGRYGIVATDFLDVDTSTLIVDTNFGSD